MYKHTVLFCIQEQEGETNIMYVCNVLVDKINTRNSLLWQNDLIS